MISCGMKFTNIAEKKYIICLCRLFIFSAVVASSIHAWSNKESMLLFKFCILVNLDFFMYIMNYSNIFIFPIDRRPFVRNKKGIWYRGGIPEIELKYKPSKCKMSRTFQQMQIHSFKKREALNININWLEKNNRATKGFLSVCFKSVVFTCIAMCIMGELCFR